MIAQAPEIGSSDQSLQSRLKALASTFLWPYRFHMAAALGAMLAQSLLLLPLPYWQGWLIDRLRTASRAGDGNGRQDLA